MKKMIVFPIARHEYPILLRRKKELKGITGSEPSLTANGADRTIRRDEQIRDFALHILIKVEDRHQSSRFAMIRASITSLWRV